MSLAMLACSAEGTDSETVRSGANTLVAAEAQAWPAAFRLSLPDGAYPAQLAASSRRWFHLGLGSSIQTPSGQLAAVGNVGDGTSEDADGPADEPSASVAAPLGPELVDLPGTVIDPRAKVGSIQSELSVFVSPEATVGGDIRSAGSVFVAVGATVDGDVVQNAALTPARIVSWSSPTPGPSAGDVTLALNETRRLSPRAYGDLRILRGTVELEAGVYFFSSLEVGPSGALTFEGPTVLYVGTRITLLGSVRDTGTRARLLVAYAGTLPAIVHGSFAGTIVAPEAAIEVGPGTHAGSFFGRDLHVAPRTTIVHRGFPLPPSTCIGAADGTACGGDESGACHDGTCVRVSCANPPDPAVPQVSSVSADYGGGLVTLTQTADPPSDQGAIRTTTSITREGRNILRTEVVPATDDSPQRVIVEYGEGFHGIRRAETTTDGETVQMVIDGRALVPFPAEQANNPPFIFEDGAPPPAMAVDDATLAMVQSITEASTVAASCHPVPPAAGTSFAALGGPARVPGHRTDHMNLPSCKECQNGCAGDFFVCTFGIAFACVPAAAIPFVGPGLYIACFAAGALACDLKREGCTGECNKVEEGCCPVGCGVGCCDRGETCLNGGSALCCSPGYNPCPGPNQSCVDPTQATCIGSGEACPFTDGVCGAGGGQMCCPPPATCTNGTNAGSVCTLPGARVHAAADTTATGAGLCVFGRGYPPGGEVTVFIDELPGSGAGGVAAGPSSVCNEDRCGDLVRGEWQHNFNFRRFVCTEQERLRNMPIRVVDRTTNLNFSTTLPATFFCEGGSDGPANRGCAVGLSVLRGLP